MGLFPTQHLLCENLVSQHGETLQTDMKISSGGRQVPRCGLTYTPRMQGRRVPTYSTTAVRMVVGVLCSVLSDSLRNHRLSLTSLLCPRDSPGKNTGVGSQVTRHPPGSAPPLGRRSFRCPPPPSAWGSSQGWGPAEGSDYL